jgi:hypothetical protein
VCAVTRSLPAQEPITTSALSAGRSRDEQGPNTATSHVQIDGEGPLRDTCAAWDPLIAQFDSRPQIPGILVEGGATRLIRGRRRIEDRPLRGRRERDRCPA